MQELEQSKTIESKEAGLETKKTLPEKEKLPKKFQWVAFLKRLEKKGYDLKYHYSDGEVSDRLKYWNFDLDNGGAEPEVPEEVVVREVKPHGNGYKTEEVAVIRDVRSRIDPDLETTLKIWSTLMA